jgi:hypothetical protein
MAAGIASAREKNERFRERRCGDVGGHVLGNRKKRAIPRAALRGWRRALRPQEKETSDSSSGAAGMAAGMSCATERNERFWERRCGDDGGHIVGKRKKRAIQNGTAGMAAGRTSATERNEGDSERRGGQDLRDRMKRALLRAALGAIERNKRLSEPRGGHRGGQSSARERSERFSERRCGDGGGHRVGKGKK